jgi:hypothetical protein
VSIDDITKVEIWQIFDNIHNKFASFKDDDFPGDVLEMFFA